MAKTRLSSSFARSVVFTLCLALCLTGLPLPASTQNQSPAQGGLRTQGPPSPNLPNLDATRSTKEAEPKLPVEKKANRCRWADHKCKREKEKKAENRNPFDNRVGDDSRLFASAAKFDFRNWRKDTLADRLLVSPLDIFSNDEFTSVYDIPVGTDADLSAPTTAAAVQSITYNDIMTARADAKYRTGTGGEDLFSSNYNWSLPIMGFAGRSGHDLGLTLSYNSTMWIRVGNTMVFDPDYNSASISPGFTLGLPTLAGPYLNTQSNKNCYQLILPSGRIVELRQLSTSTFESGDSSFTRMTIETSGYMTVRTTDGTQFKYQSPTECIEIKDRNGNLITITYNGYSQIDTITDTLGRVFQFNYGAYQTLESITLGVGYTPTLIALFSYVDNTLYTNFSGLSLYNVSNGMTYPVLSQVYLPKDNSTFIFEPSTYGQVYEIRHVPGGLERSKIRYNLPITAASSPAQSDCPKFTQRTDTAYEWNTTGVNTNFSFTTQGTDIVGQVTVPDGTVYKEIAWGTSWQRGLVKETQTLTGSTLQKKTETTWDQDIYTSYQNNPRAIESKVIDVANGNLTRRTVIGYVGYNLPADVYEYDSNQTTLLRRSHTDYNLSSTYTNRRIIGLPSAQMLYDGNNVLQSKVTYSYDDSVFLQNLSPAPVNHDGTNYGIGFVAGRANLTKTRRYDVNDASGTAYVESQTGYYISGSPAFARDALNHQTNIFYTDNFSNVTNTNTHAYPTQIQDPDGYWSYIQYHFHWGEVTRTTDPKGASVRNDYTAYGRLWQTTNEVNQAYTRYEFASNQYFIKSYSTIQDGLGEFYSITVFDGHGRTRATVSDHPGSSGQYRGVYNVYDTMGRQTQVSNPTEINASWNPAGDDLAGWAWSFQNYDWQGRPLISTNQDGSTRIASYTGCGCAGNDVTTIQGEPTATGTPENRRTQKFWRDVLGRTIKSQILNYNGTPYKTTLTEYNVRDQVTAVKQFKGDAAIGASCPLGTCEQTDLAYDGHARLQKRYMPIYQDNNVAPPYNGNPSARSSNMQYYSDDTLYIETDPRGATATYTYNNRKLVNGISYTAPSGVAARPNVSFNYDELGIRSFMSDGAGTVTYNINALGQIQSETRQFTMSGAPTTPFTINYEYGLAGQLKMVKDPFNDQINYGYDKAGRLTSVTGAAPFAGVTNYLSGVQYRAWGAVKNNRTFDIRMRLTSAYQSTGTINYQYNKANDLTYAEMTTGSPYHQTYGYDHVGRLTSVSTPEITVPSQYVQTQSNPPNGLPPTYKVRPFTTSVTYDEFDNATSSGGDYWHDITWNLNATPQSFTTTYVNGRAKKDGVAGKVYNNRDEVWTYNAMGQVTYDTRSGETYDAVGQKTRTETGPNIYVNYIYDGDGQQIKFDQKREDGSTELRYRIYSTVLGGLLTDVKPTGQKIETRVYTFVYPESTIRQVKAYSVPNFGNYPDTLVSEGSDPHGTRAKVWDRNTNTTKTVTLASPGAYVEDINWQGMKDSYVSGIGSQIAFGQYWATVHLDSQYIIVDPRNPGTGCSLNGAKIDCNKLLREAANGPNGRISLNFSTTGGRGGVGGDTGALATSFGLAAGQAASTHKYLGRRQIGGEKNDSLTFTYKGFDGADVVVFKDPPRFVDVYANDVSAFWGIGAGFGLTGGQQDRTDHFPNKWSSYNGRKKEDVYVCSRPADINVGGVNINPLGIPHKWIKTGKKEAGLGPANGTIPGQGWGSDSPYVSETAIVDHTGESKKPGATCQIVTDVDADLVNSYLVIGQRRGKWAFDINDCWVFCEQALHYGRTGKDDYKDYKFRKSLEIRRK
jgi:YD repeat-containing protein